MLLFDVLPLVMVRLLSELLLKSAMVLLETVIAVVMVTTTGLLSAILHFRFGVSAPPFATAAASVPLLFFFHVLGQYGDTLTTMCMISMVVSPIHFFLHCRGALAVYACR